jgi:hypothetical protein
LINEKVLGLSHPDVATSLNNLASLYEAQGRLINFVQTPIANYRMLDLIETPTQRGRALHGRDDCWRSCILTIRDKAKAEVAVLIVEPVGRLRPAAKLVSPYARRSKRFGAARWTQWINGRYIKKDEVRMRSHRNCCEFAELSK